jgi:CheY-like chemotaxis protein
LIEGKGVEFRIEASDSLPESIVSDGVRVRQILINLLGNACKFTEKGAVVLTVGPDAASGDRLSLAIADSGIGMSPRRLERIFEPFVQADSSISRTHGGTGLGLSITKELVTLLRGEITVTSAPGRGTTFHVRLPLHPAASGWSLPASDRSGSAHDPASDSMNAGGWSGRALVVDDAPVVRRLACRLLRNLGFEVEEASGAIEALAAYEQMGDSCEIVLLDLQMPKIDGVEASRRFRNRGYTGRLIAMSATPSYEEIALAAGCDGFLPKPFDRMQVRSLIEKLLGPPVLAKAS